MQLPGRLQSTSVGDLLGMLHRARATGTLELSEPHGRCHRVHLARGLVTAAEIDGASASLAEWLRRDRAVDDATLRRSLLRAMASRRLHGEVLVGDFKLSPTLIDAALRRQLLSRLAWLETLGDARVCFRVAVRPPRGALNDDPLRPREFLSGRRRARDTRAVAPPRADDSPHFAYETPRPPRVGTARFPTSPPPVDPRRLAALRTLGVAAGADAAAIKRAYRQLARAYHPDLHPTATDAERKALQERFVAVTAAYQALVA